MRSRLLLVTSVACAMAGAARAQPVQRGDLYHPGDKLDMTGCVLRTQTQQAPTADYQIVPTPCPPPSAGGSTPTMTPSASPGTPTSQAVPVVSPDGTPVAGSQSDAAATNSTSSWSVTSLLKGIFARLGGTLSVLDPNNASWAGESPMTVGTVYSAQRAFKANCTGAGVVSINYPDGSTGLWPVGIGITVTVAQNTGINASGTTATCTYTQVK